MSKLVENVKKVSAKTMLFVALGCMLLSMLGTWLLTNQFGSTKVESYIVTPMELAAMVDANNTVTGRNVTPLFSATDTKNTLNFNVYIPKNATAENPAPLVVTSPRSDTQLSIYLELARRGFVVIAANMGGNGNTTSGNFDPTISGDGFGLLPAVQYGMSLPCVDPTRVGLTGHSIGAVGAAVNINILNTEDAQYRVSAFVVGDAVDSVASLSPESLRGLKVINGQCRYGEFNKDVILETETGKSLVQKFYPAYNENTISEGQWFSADGPVASPTGGAKLEADSAIVFYEPNLIHIGWMFSKAGPEITVEGMYAGLGVPEGCKYIPGSSQIWGFAAFFGLLGIIGFFMMIWPMTTILVKTSLFSGIVRPVKKQSELPVLDKKSGLPILVFAIPMMFFTYWAYRIFSSTGSNYFNSANYPGGMTANGPAMYSFVSGIALIVLLAVSSLISAGTAGRSGQHSASMFAPAALDSITQLLKTCLFAFTILCAMYVPVYISHYVFHSDFLFWDWSIKPTSVTNLYIVLFHYTPFFALSYVPLAIFNACTRFKNIPDWLSTLFCVLLGILPMAFFAWQQYGAILSLGHLRYLNDAWLNLAATGSWKTIPYAAMTAFAMRHIWKKTGNAWASGLTMALIMNCVTVFSANFSSTVMFP